MSDCKRSKKALEVLGDISKGIESLKELVEEGPREDEKGEKSIREKADLIALFAKGDKGNTTYHYFRSDISSTIESLVREELEACVKLFEKRGGVATADIIKRERLNR